MDTKISGSRRRFLQNAALVGAGLSVPFIADKVSSETATPEDKDCIIIGTGFGGAVAALRLAQAGITVTMLERGRRWTRDAKGEYPEFSNFRNPTNRIGWMRTNTPVSGFGFGRGTNGADLPADNQFSKYAGIFERIDYQPTEVTGVHKVAATGIVSLGGVGVGGGSLIYNTISYKPSKELFELVFPKIISYNEMDTIYYPRVRAILKPAPTPFDILNTPYYAATRAALELGKASGLPTQLLDLDVDWSKVREELNGTRTKSAIIGDTWFGIKSGAKNSLDQNYLKMAEDTGKVTINPLHIVYDIEAVTVSGKQRYVVRCKQIDENGAVLADKAYRCRLLFMGAGSTGTSALLIKAKATGKLPNLNNYTGKGWGGNGDVLGIPFGLPATSINNLGQGGPALAKIEDFTNPINPISITFLSKWNSQHELLGLGMATPRNFGLAKLLTMTLTQRDTILNNNYGKFTYNSGTDTSTLNFPLSANAEVVKSLSKMLTTIKSKAVNYFIQNPPFILTIGLATGHPLGGMVMGLACDYDGRVLGYQGLYVVDGALIPGFACSANPSLTIAAIAERCMDRLKSELNTVNA